MIKAPIPQDDEERLKTLRSYQILDTIEEEHFDEVTRAAALMCGCEISVISLVDKDRQWLKSKQGLDVSETPRDISFCGHAITGDDIFIVENAKNDERFCDNPLVLNLPNIQFYAGVPLVAPNGHRLGTLCVIDKCPKTLSEEKKLLLKTLAKQVVNYLEISKLHREKHHRINEIEFYRKGLDEHAIVAKTDIFGKITFVNDKFCEISKYSREELLGQDHRILNSGMHSKDFFEKMWSTIQSDKPWRGEIHNRAKDGTFYWVDTTILPHQDEKGIINEYMTFRYDVTDKKEAETLNREIQKINKVGGWEIEVETMTPVWTEETYVIHGVEFGEKIDLINAINFYAPHERERIQILINKCIEQAEPFEGDFEFISARNEKKWVQTKGVPEVNTEGKVIRLVGTFQDITIKKNLEKELLKTNEFLDMALEGAGLGIWDCNLETDVISYDKRWAEILGLGSAESEITLENWEGLVHPDDKAGYLGALKDYLDGKTTRYENIHRVKHRLGHWVYVLDKGRVSDRDPEGKPIRLTGTYLDITETQNIHEKKLNEINEILSATPSCLKIVNKKGELIDMNPQGLALIGAKTLAEVFHANVYDIVEESHRQNFIDFNERVCAGAKESLIFEIISLDGTRRWMESYAAPYKLPGGEYAQIAITNDITEKVEREEDYKNQKALAHHNNKLASIGELAAGVGHEINNPLAIAKGYVEVLYKLMDRDQDLDKDKIQSYLSNIDIAINRIAKIVQALRTFSRVDSTKYSDFSPILAIEESFNLIHEIYKGDGINLSLVKDVIDDNVLVRGNVGEFQQVVMNLISNAKDAISNNTHKKIVISCKFDEDKVKVSVKDNGFGISAELRDKIFNPFFTTKDMTKGTGIGLSLVQNIIKEMGGTITVESKLGHGATFSIELPAKNESLVDSSLSTVQCEVDSCSLKANILIVDDEEGIRDLFFDMLDGHGLNITLVENGKIALAEIQANPKKFDVVISDMQMPEMDGKKLLKNIRSNTEIRQPKFIFSTGGTNINFEAKEYDLKDMFDGYILKPFDEQKIFDVLTQCLGSKKKNSA